MPSTEQDPVTSNFPGISRFLVAHKALDHLERNFATFEKIFGDFNIQKSDYRLLAGFDEDLIQGRLGLLNQIHILLLSEPKDITSLLSRLSPALGDFSAFVFTDKSKYRIPLSLPDFNNITRRETIQNTHELPSCVSKLSQNMGRVPLTVAGPGGPSDSGHGGNTPSWRKGKEREDTDRVPPDSGKEAGGDADPQSPDPDSDTWSAEVSFRVANHLHQYDQARERGEPFQKLEVQGTVKVTRTSESQDLDRFATCKTEFTELDMTTELNPGKPMYRYFHLDVCIDAKGAHTFITKIRPLSTPKYNPETKVTAASKKAFNALFSATISTFGASGSRTAEQTIATEKTSLLARIIQRNIRSKISWSFQTSDSFNQETGTTLSTERLPRAHFEFLAKDPAPPPEDLTIEIYTYWSLLSPPGRNAWLSPEGSPSFSNLCEAITLKLPSHLRGRHIYDVNLLVWPKNANQGSTATRREDVLDEGVEGLVSTKVTETKYDVKAQALI